MLLTKQVEIKPSGKSIQYYRDLGYDAKWCESLMVRVEDLPRGSHIRVLVKCDYCGKEKWICYRNYLESVEKYGLYSCNKCLHYKSEETNFLKYGTYHYSTTIECKEKVKNTCLLLYGTDCPAKNDNIKEKTRLTNLQRYGVPYTQQSPEIRAKANKTLCENGNQKTSKQQLYLHNLYGGKLNYFVKYYAIDICFPEEKIVLEYDGGFHDGRVKLGRLTQEEFDHKELIRDKIIKSEGYKIIRIKSNSDKLPQDSTLLQMLSEAKQYFSEYPNHSWCEYNLDTSTVRNAEHKDGIPYSFGELRKIKDSDLPEIENNNNTNLKGA